MWRPVDIYCERTGPEFWAEPLNAWTNLGFFIAAALLARGLARLRRTQSIPGDLWLLPILLAGIGTGSFLFHTLAVVWTGILDVLFIALFVWSFVAIYLVRVARWPVWAAALGVLGIIGAQVIMPRLCTLSSCAYLPALAGTLLLGLLALSKRDPSAGYLLGAGGTFVVSLFFRSVDIKWCEALPIGTHWIWHLLNALVLGLCSAGLVRSIATPSMSPVVQPR